MNTTNSENLLTLDIIDFTVEGDAFAKNDGKAVFIESEGLCAVPGDIVTAKVIQETKKITKCQLVQVTTPSTVRVNPWCSYSEECGGCMWQHVSMETQHEWKQRHVEQTLMRLGGCSSLTVLPIVASPEQHFRTRVTYAFGTQESSQVLGLKKRKSTTIIPVDICGLQPELASYLLTSVKKHILNGSIRVWDKDLGGALRYLIIYSPKASGAIVAELILGKATKNERIAAYQGMKKVLDDLDCLRGIIVSERRSPSTIAQAENILYEEGDCSLTEDYCGKSFRFPTGAFMQTNTDITHKVYETISKWASAYVVPSGGIWDLYCGSGAIGLLCAQPNTPLYFVDSSKESIEHARLNAQGLNLASEHTHFYSGDVEKGIQLSPFSPDCIILDPPRAGLSEGVIKALTKVTTKAIIYCSCDVGTQARDTRKLAEFGWKVIKAQPFDMFPWTAHIENLMLLERV